MSLSVEGQKCPVCKSYMFDDEDIVFCPVCGAPSHRDCYNLVGHCPLEEFHGTDKQYKKPENINLEDEPKAETQKPRDFNEVPFGFKTIEIDLLGGIKKDDQIAGISAQEMKGYVGPNSQYYIPRFFKLNNRNKKSWNWSAFILPEGFFFFRKCHKTGIFATLLSAASWALIGFANEYIMLPETTNYNEMLTSILSQLNASPEKTAFGLMAMFLGVTIFVLLRVFLGLFANRIYRNDVFEKIKKIKESDDFDDKDLALKLKGGINPFFAISGIMAARLLATYILMFVL